MISRKRNRHNAANSYSKTQNAVSNDDVRYIIEKIKSRSIATFSNNDNPSNNPALSDKPLIFKNYIDFLTEYVKFTLSNITNTYEVIVKNWLDKNPILMDKIKFVDSNNIKGVIFKNISEYAEYKLRPGIISSIISRRFTDNEASKIWANTETYNPPALAFLGPPGTAKTNAITSALASLAQGGENRLVWDWLRYDITTHEVTTAPLVLPVASDVVTDNPLTTVALMRSTGHREIDIALTENIQTKTLSKIIATFAYILKGGYENKRIELRPEVQEQITNNVLMNSLKLETWKFVTTYEITSNNVSEIVRPLIDSFSTRLRGFKSIVESIDSFAQKNGSVTEWINYINNGLYLDQSIKNKQAVAEQYANEFREICHLLSDLIVFGLTPVIAETFRNFFMEIGESKNENLENGIMYIYHKIHNDYLHRIVSRIFLLYIISNINKTQDEIKKLFDKMIKELQVGLYEMLQEYKDQVLSGNAQEYYNLEEAHKGDATIIGEDSYEHYNNFNRFLLKMEFGVEYKYTKLDILFIKNVVSRFNAGNIQLIKSFSNISRDHNALKAAMYSYDRLVQEDSGEHFSVNRLSFTDELGIMADALNDLNEISRYYSNNPNADLRTTAQRLGDSFGRQFLNLSDNSTQDVPYHLSIVFSFMSMLVKLFDVDAGEVNWKPSKYEDDISKFKSSLTRLFRKSLSIINNNPKLGVITANNNLNEELRNKNIDIFEIIADYFLARLGVVESVYTPGAIYSFPAPIQVFLKKARDSYLKVLNKTNIDLDQPNPPIELPIYVLFIDEILTKLTKQDFTFWLNIWNGLVSPNTDINQAFPPNVCFIVAGNMPTDWRLLEQALLQRSKEEIQPQQPDDDKKINFGPSTDTLNALGSRINIYIVTYDYSYLIRTDDSAIKKRTNLFITSLVDAVINNKDNIVLLDTAINIIGGFYDYYKAIVAKRLSVVKEQNNEELARLHAYIASLTARANVTPYNMNNIEPNRTILHLIEAHHGTNITSATYKDIVIKATKLNYLLNSTVFGKSIYKHMLLDYFRTYPQEAIYFKRMITLTLSPVVLHLSLLHAYLTWNNIMRNIADDLFNTMSSELDTNKSLYYENTMETIQNVAVLLNRNTATTNKLNQVLKLEKKSGYATDRIVDLLEKDSSKNYWKVLKEKKDVRYCHPYVGAFISLLTLAFYNYIKYMKKFNPHISDSILNLWNNIRGKILDVIEENLKRENPNANTDMIKNNIETLEINIDNYFIDNDYKRADVIFEKSKKTSDNAVEIKVIAFNKSIKTPKGAGIANAEIPYESGNHIYIDAIAVKINKTGQEAGSTTETDIEAIKALVKYTIYTYIYKIKNGYIDSASLVDYVMGSSNISIEVPIIKNIMAGFFREPQNDATFIVEPLREMDRWFTNVSSSVVRYVTIMFILKHILTYEHASSNNEMQNLIVNLINAIIEKINETDTRAKDDFDALLREFASLLYRYKEAVFTPLAGDEKEFRLFSYDYYSASGTTKEYDGYYMNPSNLVNFGPLSFIMENLKDVDIIQIGSNDQDSYIATITRTFLDNFRGMGSIPTTFIPIHLVSHLDKTNVGTIAEQKIKLSSGTIPKLILGKIGISGIESDAFKVILDTSSENDEHTEYYEISERNRDINILRVMNVLSNQLSHIKTEKFPELAGVIERLASINKTIKDSYNKNLLKMIESANVDYGKMRTLIVDMDEGIFSDLRKATRKYPSVDRYIKLWDNEQNKIKSFFSKLFTVLSKRSASKDAQHANELLDSLDTYIQKAATEAYNKIKQYKDNDNKPLEKVKILLMTLKDIDGNKLNGLISRVVKNIIEHESTKSEQIKIEALENLDAMVRYHTKILSPVIRYVLAVLLSNILLEIQYDELMQYLIDIDKSFRTSYMRTGSYGSYENKEYLDMLIEYMFYDINRLGGSGEDNKIVLKDGLVVKSESESYSTSANGIGLVVPVFTGSPSKGHAIVRYNKSTNTITGRRVYTQYAYIENDNNEPRLYCDIHHLPIKGVRNVDGVLIKSDPLMDIASTPQEHGISYFDVMFTKDWAEARYEFAPSTLVNVLLIIGTYLAQNLVLYYNMDSEFVSRFLPFVVTNMYSYYKEVVETRNSEKDIEEFLNNVINNVYQKPIHPLIAALALALNQNDDDIKNRLREDYGIGTGQESTYSRIDNFMRDLRLRFYSAQKVSGAKFNMYSIYEPGVVIEYSNTTQQEQNE